MRVPQTDTWIREAQRAHAAESARWQYIFGRFDAAELGGAVLSAQFTHLLRQGATLVRVDDAAILTASRSYRPGALAQLRAGTTKAALAGGLGALKRMNLCATATHRLGLQQGPAPHLRILQRLGSIEAIVHLLQAWVPAQDLPVRLITSRADEVVAYRAAGIELIGQEGICQAFTSWALATG